MYEELTTKLKGVRRQAISTIKNFMVDNNIEEINCNEVSNETPSIGSSGSLDEIILEDGKLSFTSSGWHREGFHNETEISTDCLLDIVRFIEYYDEEIKEYGSK